MKFTFEFDPGKSATNKTKHGIDFVEAQALWKDHVAQIPANVVNRQVRYANLGVIKQPPLDGGCNLPWQCASDHFRLSIQ